VYGTHALTATLPDQSNGYGTSWLALAPDGMQNGSPDGLALVCAGVVVQFLSYEGTIVADGGAAAGMTSVSIGVAESSSAPVGTSLQLTGAGNAYASFIWAAEVAATPGAPNAGQTFL
ncbi:MAG: endonuclease I, partial [Polyangiaceae bacterium]|nr:endonuclease I [Polyangiaceae bacterium]